MASQVKDSMSRPAIFIDPEATVAMPPRSCAEGTSAVRLSPSMRTTSASSPPQTSEQDHRRRSGSERDGGAQDRDRAAGDGSARVVAQGLLGVHARPRVHHLPVMDQRGMIIGMISATEILMAVEEAGRGKSS